MKRPTPVIAPYSFYKKRNRGVDSIQKYKMLEATYHALIKYISVTFLVIAKERNSELYTRAYSSICEGSSLGGWVNAMRIIVEGLEFKKLKDGDSPPAQKYLTYFHSYRNHPDKEKLDEYETIVNNIAGEFRAQGYKFSDVNKPNVIKLFHMIVEIRNKCAHGNIRSVTYDHFIDGYKNLLEELLYFLPLGEFTLYGSYNKRKLKFVGNDPESEESLSSSLMCIESDLMLGDSEPDVPFMQYHSDRQKMYFLNDKVAQGLQEREFIDYTEGGVVSYWRMERAESQNLISESITKRLRTNVVEKDYDLIANLDQHWVPLTLDKSSLALLPDKGHMIYTFSIRPEVSSEDSYDMLYVGQSINPKQRFTEYLQIAGEYNKDRKEITAMFNRYKGIIEFEYIILENTRAQLSQIESAFYKIFSPPYNLIAPPTRANESERRI